MIVKCEQCQTRFKIPDEKITGDKGVKVRCTKCAHTFRVTKDHNAGVSGAVPAIAPVGGGTPSHGTASSAPTNLVPAMSAPGSGETPPQGATFLDDPEEEQTRRAVFALGIEASKIPSLAPGAKPPTSSKSGVSKPFDFSSLLPAGAPTIRSPAHAPPTMKAPAASPPAAAPAPSSFDFSSLPPTPQAGAPAPAPEAPAAPASSPFDFSTLGEPPAGPGGPRSAIDSGSFDFSTLADEAAAAAKPSPAKIPAPPPKPSPALAPPAMDFSELPPPPEAPAPSTKTPSRKELFSDLPDMEFASPPDQSTQPRGELFDDLPPPSNHSTPGTDLFDAAAEAETRDRAVQVPVARIKLAKARADGEPEPDALPSTDTEQPQFEPPSRPKRNVGAFFANVAGTLVVAFVLVLVVIAATNEGKLDSSTLSVKSLTAAQPDFPASDISNGLYETKLGKPVFFVRGVVTNRSATATRVRVRAEIIDGPTVISSAEVIAGAPATPEQLHALSAPDEAQRLLLSVSKLAPAVAPGSTAPFLVTFFEYPPDLKDFRVRVTARAEKAETAAR